MTAASNPRSSRQAIRTSSFATDHLPATAILVIELATIAALLARAPMPSWLSEAARLFLSF